ncbi:MAG: hypothetical protein M0Z57_07290 [Deltaproteobacteria bacterium]|jgi:hypothetical protein|uniref:Uncharacterized protein n=1 Tax=Candidatus Acidulodesulfobacterium acidiphilum TaxID=2597224 RepID=A0A520X797_9DELT|nr:hypothetical protein [Deltaproteobacteria bacterium]MDA8299785.1 hypothetical protein [Deltaproteobacteria bacterium]RZV37077.1 MAG: hypothetical protein EVJ48_09555 [Candidatus Acidulodesulfobacterium acidiphilum]
MKILYLIKEKIDGDLAKSFNSVVAAQKSEGIEVLIINLWEIDSNGYDSVLDKIFEYDKTICV